MGFKRRLNRDMHPMVAVLKRIGYRWKEIAEIVDDVCRYAKLPIPSLNWKSYANINVKIKHLVNPSYGELRQWRIECFPPEIVQALSEIRLPPYRQGKAVHDNFWLSTIFLMSERDEVVPYKWGSSKHYLLALAFWLVEREADWRDDLSATPSLQMRIEAADILLRFSNDVLIDKDTLYFLNVGGHDFLQVLAETPILRQYARRGEAYLAMSWREREAILARINRMAASLFGSVSGLDRYWQNWRNRQAVWQGWETRRLLA